MSTQEFEGLSAPELIERDSISFVGLPREYSAGEVEDIPLQWDAFNALGLVNKHKYSYGVCVMSDTDKEKFVYVCAVEAKDIPDELGGVLERFFTMPNQYAVFRFNGSVERIGEVWRYIWEHGLSQHGLAPYRSETFERYGPKFNPETGEGGFDIWIPAASGSLEVK